MALFPIDLKDLDRKIAAIGLKRMGVFRFGEEHLRKGDQQLLGRTGVLIGNTGPDMWSEFSLSPEYADGGMDPMNRWTKRVLETLAQGLCETCIFPFDEPYWPFQRFLSSAAGLKPSPLGLYMHPEYGLWHALRGVLVFSSDEYELLSHFNAEDENSEGMIQHPCDSCDHKPCLSACPVDAFTGSALNVDPCFAHLDSKNDPACMEIGCRARHACPIGTQHRYTNEQIRFHMRSYRY